MLADGSSRALTSRLPQGPLLPHAEDASTAGGSAGGIGVAVIRRDAGAGLAVPGCVGSRHAAGGSSRVTCGTIAAPHHVARVGARVPRSRNTRIRPKDTSRIEARRRYREEHRATEPEPNVLSDQAAATVTTTESRSAFALPNIREDIAALPMVFRKPLVWAPFGILLLAFLLELARQSGALPEGQLQDFAVLYIQLTLPPTSLFVFFIGGFVAPRASYLVGAILGAFDALLITILVTMEQTDFEDTGITEVAEGLVPLWGIAILVGIFAAGFAAWYRRFLRSSQERARANRAIREKEQAEKARERARADKQAAREARRK
jgi:hypothetical protein